jgi:predicted ArsR family transcriptional regulator
MRIINTETKSSDWDRFIPRVSQEVEIGFETAQQIATQQGIDQNNVRRRLKKLVAVGEVEEKIFKVGKNYATHYRIIKKHEKSSRKNS